MECPHIPNISYGEFSKRLHANLAGKRIPINGSIELTARCNLSCSHCYINLPADEQDALRRELTQHELYDILDQIVDEGCLWLLLTGGEPLIRTDFIDVLYLCQEERVVYFSFHQRYSITPRIADLLSRVATVRCGNHPLWPYQENLRTSHWSTRAPSNAA